MPGCDMCGATIEFHIILECVPMSAYRFFHTCRAHVLNIHDICQQGNLFRIVLVKRSELMWLPAAAAPVLMPKRWADIVDD